MRLSFNLVNVSGPLDYCVPGPAIRACSYDVRYCWQMFIVQYIMEEIFFAGTPLLEAVGLREPFVEELRDTIRDSINKATIPMKAYALQYESFLPILNVDPVTYVRSAFQRFTVSAGSFITGPPTRSVGGRLVTVAGVCHRLSSSSVTLHGGPAGGFTRAGQAMTSCRLQSNYSSTVTLHGGPVVLCPVRGTPCLLGLRHRTVSAEAFFQAVRPPRSSGQIITTVSYERLVQS